MTTSNTSDVYTSEYPPDSSVPESLKEFLKHYYTTVDIPGNHEVYATCFAQDAHLVAHGHEWSGRNALRELHKGMWDGIKGRVHMPLKVFPFGGGEHKYELMISGTLEYDKTDGTSERKDMAVRGKYAKNGAVWEITYLQVWLTP
ncbi:hypothetical protein EJ08DRAFT_298125 [Tothia fuscella]|uniref:SnoaL-like domain-containing protein n=1 Tax=Tothia fuscella TaxID=1048955 RepID=A0A9P4NPJ2_9PEZI|nr:hypothetical protein EJ08DRAFT_298125 [Tothia fuscella]